MSRPLIRLTLLALAAALLPGMQVPDPQVRLEKEDRLQVHALAAPAPLPTQRGPRQPGDRDIEADMRLFVEQFTVAVDRREVADPLAEARALFRHRRGHALIDAATPAEDRIRLQAVLAASENALTDMLLNGWSLRLNGASCTMGGLLRQRLNATLELDPPAPTLPDSGRDALCRNG